MADEIIIETVSAEVIEVGVPGPQGPAGAAGTGLETLTTKGDTLYRGDTTGERLPIGTTGQILRVSASGIPEWGSAPASGVSSVNGETGEVTLDGSEIDTSGNDDLAAFVTYEFADGNGLYYPLPDTTIGNKRVYRTTTGHHVFFENLRWHITDGSPITANIIESSDDDNAAWPWLSAWNGSIEKAQLSTVVGRARSTFLFVGDNIPNTSVSGLATVAASGDYDDLSGKPTIPTASIATPAALGTAAAGTSTDFSRADHVHAMPSANDVGAADITHTHTVFTDIIGALSEDPDGARAELGLGGAAVLNVGTTTGTVAAGDDARLSDSRTPSSHASSHAASGSDPLFDQDLDTTDSPTFVDVNATGVISASNGGIQIGFIDGAEKITASAGNGAQIDFENGVITGLGIATRDDFFTVFDYDAPTKIAAFDASNITAGSTRTFSFPDASGTLALSGDAPASHTHAASDITSGSFGNISHDGKLGTTAGLPLVTTTAGAVTTLALGAAGTVLTVNGTADGVEFAAASGGGVTGAASSASDVLGVSGSDITGVDAGSDKIVFWDDSASELTYLATVGPTFDGTNLRWPVELIIACSDETSNLTTGTAKVTFRAPYAFLLTGVRASVNTAPTGSTLIVDINNGANSALSTKLSIDASEKTSTTAASAAVINTAYDDFSDDAEITIDIDQIGSTIAGKGLKVTLIGTRA